MNSLNSSQKINDIIFLFKTIEENKHNLNLLIESELINWDQFYYFQIHEKIVDNFMTLNSHEKYYQKNYTLNLNFFIPLQYNPSSVQNLNYQFYKFNIEILFPIYYYIDNGFEVHLNHCIKPLISKVLLKNTQILTIVQPQYLETFNEHFNLYEKYTYIEYHKHHFKDLYFYEFLQEKCNFILNNHINSIITLKNQYFSKFDFNTENFPLNVFGQDDIAQKIKSTFESYMEDFKNLSGKTLQSTTLPELMSIIHQNNIKHDYISMNADLGTSNIHKDIKNTKI